MAVTVQNVRIQLRRTNDYVYAEHPEFLPLKGEVCLCDTANEGLKVKVGDGVTTYAELPWYYPVGGQGDATVQLGYYYNNNFYEDPSHTKLIQPTDGGLYIDKQDNSVYYYSDGEYHSTMVDVAYATEERAGIAKLYDEKGQNIDGAMTQRATTEAVNERVLKLDVRANSETLIVNY